MLDTIVLTLNRRQFRITEPDKFEPSARQLLNIRYSKSAPKRHCSCWQEASKQEKKAGIYKPRLSLNKRPQMGGFVITLRVEFSAPKLLFGNNFDELSDSDFKPLVKKLRAVLDEMGVRVSEKTLAKVNVSAIHYSKNIILTDYASSSMVIRELGKVDMTKRLDLNNTDYRNEGHAIRFHSNSYEITFYDKIKDMQQARISEKRAVEKDSAMQLELFMQYIAPKPWQVMRMEIRLNQRKKIRDVLGKVERDRELTFHCLYDSQLSRTILLYYWHLFHTRLRLSLPNELKPEDRYLAIQRASTKPLTPAKTLQLAAALNIADSIGMRGLRNLLGGSARSWQRLKKELELLEINQNVSYRSVTQVDDILKAWRTVKLTQEKM